MKLDVPTAHGHSGAKFRPSGLPSTAKLLAEGGDARILLREMEGTNQYDCGPYPDPDLLAFGSSTASVISTAGFAAAERLRQSLQEQAGLSRAGDLYRAELECVRKSLLDLIGLQDFQGLELVFGASGTDLHLIASQLLAASDGAPLHAVMVDEDETGSGVSLALSGRHFSGRSPLGSSLSVGAGIPGGLAVEVASIPMREADGGLRAAEAIDSEFQARVDRAMNAGKRVLLVLVDVSKTGLRAPSPDLATALKERYPGRLEVLVDACQFRIGKERLRTYLARDFMVAVTGSKFITGPAFCGALLFPPELAQRMRKIRPSGLSAYSAKAEWPSDWAAAGQLRDVANFGLLLRWTAALTELAAFDAVPSDRVSRSLNALSNAVIAGLGREPELESLPMPPIDAASRDWDRLPSIFPFLLHRVGASGKRQPLTRRESTQIHRMLRQGPLIRCQLGQPVACGLRDAIPVSALRLCASARLIVEANAQDGEDYGTLIDRALTVLEQTAWQVRRIFGSGACRRSG